MTYQRNVILNSYSAYLVNETNAPLWLNLNIKKGMIYYLYVYLFYQLNSGALISRLRKHFRDGEGVYDVHFESPNEVLTADFNSALRLWDLRYNYSAFIQMM